MAICLKEWMIPSNNQELSSNAFCLGWLAYITNFNLYILYYVIM